MGNAARAEREQAATNGNTDEAADQRADGAGDPGADAEARNPDQGAEDGEGETAVREYIDRHAYRHNAYRAVFQARKRVNPVTFDELRDVTDIWVEAAMGLSESDLRRMARLTAAQDRRRMQQDAAMVAALSAE